VSPSDPRFGKPIACDGPFHTPDRLARLAALSNLSAGDLTRRLSDIDEMHYFRKVRAVDDDGKEIWCDELESNRAMLQAARKMIKDPFGWLYIHGGPGNAKSEVLISIVNEANGSGNGPAMYVTFSHLVNWVREANKPGAAEDYIARFDRLLNIKLLAVDEMDKARSTEFADEFRFHFLDERYRQAIRGETQMIFASNSNPDILPIPLWDRIRDGRFKVVENTAPSARPRMRRTL
jgi:DNA replication protein DnaC